MSSNSIVPELKEVENKTTEIIWVFGSSAAGKETFIKHVVEKEPKHVLDTLNWKGKELIACQESIDYIAQYDGDPLGEKREELVKIIPKLAQKPNSVVLVKGQVLDLNTDRLLRIKELTPNATHKIIFLNTKIDTLFERVQRKSWWKEGYDQKALARWLKSQIRRIQDLQGEFEIIGIDSSNMEDWHKSDFPPKEGQA